jgi:hypothetical protein
MSAWRQIGYGFIGNFIFALFAAICAVLGFGPNQWAEYLISGMPLLITPQVLRLIFLLLASLSLARLLGEAIISSGRAKRTLFIGVTCLPFVIGSFYVTSQSYDRHLSHNQKNGLLVNLKRISSRVPNPILVGSVSDPEAEEYAAQFLNSLKFHNIPTVEIYGDPPDNTILAPYTIHEFGRMTGISISGRDTRNPPEDAKAFLDAMRSAGFSINFERFYGRMPNGIHFMLSILYNR